MEGEALRFGGICWGQAGSYSIYSIVEEADTVGNNEEIGHGDGCGVFCSFCFFLARDRPLPDIDSPVELRRE